MLIFLIYYWFFSEYIKNFKYKFKEDIIETKNEGDYLYYCDKDINISKLKNVNMTFEFDYNNLFHDIFSFNEKRKWYLIFGKTFF